MSHYLLPCMAIAVAVHASPLAPRDAVAEETTLEDLARIYRTGPQEAAVETAAQWSNDRITAEIRRFLAAEVAHRKAEEEHPVLVLPSLDVVGREPHAARDSGEERDAGRRAAAAVLAEASVHRLRRGDRRLLGPGLSSASLLLDTETLDPAFVRRFYLLAGLLLHWRVEIAAGYGLLAKASQRFPDDPELQTALGSMVETVASLRTYELPPGSAENGIAQSGRYASEEGGVGGLLPDATLARAEAHYERALVLEPDLAEARLRLARVRLLNGRVEEALPDLARVAMAAVQPRQRYLAWLFTGYGRQRQGDAAGAAAAFRACFADGSRTQTALLALGRSFDQLGDTAGAQEAFAAASALGAPLDPWWTYGAGQPGRFDALVTQLRELAAGDVSR